MKNCKDALVNLMKVKSIWSLMAAAMFCYLTVSDGISGEIALSVITSIVTYYFAKERKEAESDADADA